MTAEVCGLYRGMCKLKKKKLFHRTKYDFLFQMKYYKTFTLGWELVWVKS